MNPIAKYARILKTRAAAAGLLAMAATSAHAHPGHAFHGEGVSHYLTSPYHLAVLAVLGLALCSAAFVSRRPVVRRALAASGAVALVLAGILWQMPA